MSRLLFFIKRHPFLLLGIFSFLLLLAYNTPSPTPSLSTLEFDPAEDEEVQASTTRSEEGNEDLSVDQEDVRELPNGCASKRDEHPGLGRGSRAQFIHTPKAGGTSVEKAMFAWEGKGRWFRFNGPLVEGSNSVCPGGTLSADVLAGHRGFGYCRDVDKSDRGLFTFTTVRNALTRAVSLFDMNVKRLKDPLFTRTFGSKPLKEWLKEFNRTTDKVEPGEALVRFMGSQQCRFLCGYECFLPKNRSMNDPNYLFERAKENLLKLDAVGVTERMDELIPQLKFHLRWLPVGFNSWPHDNKVKNPDEKSEMDDDAWEILEQYSQPDMKLHALADELADLKTKEALRCLGEQTYTV